MNEEKHARKWFEKRMKKQKQISQKEAQKQVDKEVGWSTMILVWTITAVATVIIVPALILLALTEPVEKLIKVARRQTK